MPSDCFVMEIATRNRVAWKSLFFLSGYLNVGNLATYGASIPQCQMPAPEGDGEIRRTLQTFTPESLPDETSWFPKKEKAREAVAIEGSNAPGT
jgi:hypothetical protein